MTMELLRYPILVRSKQNGDLCLFVEETMAMRVITSDLLGLTTLTQPRSYHRWSDKDIWEICNDKAIVISLNRVQVIDIL